MVSHSQSLARFLCVIAICLVVHRLTGSILAATVTAALLAAWRPLRIAVWLGRHDEHPERLRLTLTFLLAIVFLMVAVESLNVIVWCIVVELWTGNQPSPFQVMSALVVGFGSLAICTLIGAVAIIAAMRSAIRVWVHPDLPEFIFNASDHTELKRANTRFNYASFVLAVTIVLPSVSIPIIVLILIGSLNPNAMHPIVLAISYAMLGLLLITPITAAISFKNLRRHVIADNFSDWLGQCDGLGRQSGN